MKNRLFEIPQFIKKNNTSLFGSKKMHCVQLPYAFMFYVLREDS